MAIVLSIQNWWHYLVEMKFFICIDQYSLKFLLEQRLVAVEHQKWLAKILVFDFKIIYRPRNGKCKWPPNQSHNYSISIQKPFDLTIVDQKNLLNKNFHELVTKLKRDPTCKPPFNIVGADFTLATGW